MNHEAVEALRAEHYREQHASGLQTCGYDGESWPCRVRLLFVYYDAATRPPVYWTSDALVFPRRAINGFARETWATVLP